MSDKTIGEIERLQKDNQQIQLEKRVDRDWLESQVLYHHGLAERYRKALEEIANFKKGDALTYVQMIKEIAQQALKEANQ